MDTINNNKTTLNLQFESGILFHEGTVVRVISSDLQLIARHVRFTTVPCKPSLIQLKIECRRTWGYSVHCKLHAIMYTVSLHLISSYINNNIYEIRDKKGFKGIVVNRSCHSLNERSFEITLTVWMIIIDCRIWCTNKPILLSW